MSKSFNFVFLLKTNSYVLSLFNTKFEDINLKDGSFKLFKLIANFWLLNESNIVGKCKGLCPPRNSRWYLLQYLLDKSESLIIWAMLNASLYASSWDGDILIAISICLRDFSISLSFKALAYHTCNL